MHQGKTNGEYREHKEIPFQNIGANILLEAPALDPNNLLIVKKWIGRGGIFFCRNFFLKNLSTLEYAHTLMVTWVSMITSMLYYNPPLKLARW